MPLRWPGAAAKVVVNDLGLRSMARGLDVKPRRRYVGRFGHLVGDPPAVAHAGDTIQLGNSSRLSTSRN